MQNNFGGNYGNEKIITEKPNELITWKKSHKDLKKALRQKYISIYSEQNFRIYQIGKYQAMMAYMDLG